MSLLRPRLGRASRVVAALAAVLFLAGMVAMGLVNRWAEAAFCAWLTFVCAFGAIRGVDLVADHPGQQSFKRWKPGENPTSNVEP